MKTTRIETAITERSGWTPARVYFTYRIFIALLVLGLFEATQPAPLLGQFLPGVFSWTAWLYLIFAIISGLVSEPLTRKRATWWMLGTLGVDIIALTLLIHCSGGVGSSPSILLLVSVAAANILLPGRMGLLVAALATIAIIFEQFYYSISLNYTNPFELTESGLFGLSFFVVSLIIQQIAQRLARSEELASLQRREIARLEELNRQIVQRMRTGILVFTPEMRVIVCNSSAKTIFGHDLNGEELPETIAGVYRQWLMNPERTQDPVFVSGESQAINAGFARLEKSPDSPVIAFLEDRSRMVQEAQQLKLASLGRMSATIAHEIRNPLSAINHAAGLLHETSREPGDERLLSIIETHVNRVNAIISDILNISRRPSGTVERRNLAALLESFVEERAQHNNDASRITIEEGDRGIQVRFDLLQLQQVLDNLVSNAFIHGDEDVKVTLSWGVHGSSGLPWLSVCDNGEGIPEESRGHLFEPFFTTSWQGSGLGLFICREICEANQARLDYRPNNPGACFVITFSHPDKVFE